VFRATFVGWQGWMFASMSARLLVDPLLTDTVGRGPLATRQRFLFWPLRKLDGGAFPEVDAVFISHEHEDHFNLPTLARVDRRIPVWLSARSSRAARAVLADLGFQVTLVHPGDTLRVGDIELTTYSPDHRPRETQDEWDTLAYLVEHAEGRFFTNVDVPMTPAMMQATSTPTECLTFLEMELRLGAPQVPALSEGAHRPPDRALFARGKEALAGLRGGRSICPLPGQTAVFSAGKLVEIEDATPFLRTDPEATWPARPGFWPAPGAPIEPLHGPRDFDESLVEELEAELDRFAEFLHGRALFRELYSLSRNDLGGRSATFALVLLSGDGDAYAYAYRPEGCCFESLDDAEALDDRFMGVVLCWASDLLAALRGVFEPRGMARSIRERWRPPIRARLFTGALWPYLHPLRMPARCLAQYRALLAEEAGAEILVRARR
jgi:hypothetical protein